jgi:hypothetical protein
MKIEEVRMAFYQSKKPRGRNPSASKHRRDLRENYPRAFIISSSMSMSRRFIFL